MLDLSWIAATGEDELKHDAFTQEHPLAREARRRHPDDRSMPRRWQGSRSRCTQRFRCHPGECRRGLAAPAQAWSTWAGRRSVDTKNKKRDEHLRSADFFDAANRPDITFTVDGIKPGNGGVRVTGSLTVRDQTRPVSFDATVSSADGETRLDGEIQVNRADFGLTWNQMGMASMRNTITIHAVFTRP